VSTDLAAEQAAAWATLSPAAQAEYGAIMGGLGSDRERVEAALADLTERLNEDDLAPGISHAIRVVRAALAGVAP
jgi:hypothetical protein